MKGAKGKKPDVVPLREWMASTKVPRRNQVAGLRQFAGAVPTKKKLKSWGAQIDVNCEFCGQVDDEEHRLWSCCLAADLRRSLDADFKWYMVTVGSYENKVKGWFEQPAGGKTPRTLEATMYEDGELCEDKGTWRWTEGRPI